MKTITYVLISFISLLVSLTVSKTSLSNPVIHDHEVHWDYKGACGPEHWGDLAPDFCKCKEGQRQSPIGISTTEKTKLDSIVFNYYPTHLKIINNGHTIQVNYEKGSSISIGKDKYELVQFHFHTPSEHHIKGTTYDMEAHLVHKNEHGKLAVVAVFLKESETNNFIYTLWHNMPKEKGKERIVPDIKINALQLLPAERGYYTYSGSLTTPPGSECVTWFLLKTPVGVSRAEVEEFTALFEKDARPIQHPYGRVVKESD